MFHQSTATFTYLLLFVVHEGFFTSLILLSIGKNMVSWFILHFKQFNKYLLILSCTMISAAVIKMKGCKSFSERILSLVQETENKYFQDGKTQWFGDGLWVLLGSESFLCHLLAMCSWESFLISLYLREVNQHVHGDKNFSSYKDNWGI